MNKFIESSASRETSPELMSAILKVANGDETEAERIWEDATDAELVAVIEIVTNNGMHETTDFVWGVAGSDWAV